MNVELLKEFCEKIISIENRYSIQKRLEKLRASIEAVTSNPQDQGQQQNLASALTSLQEAISSFEGEFSPREMERLAEIRAYDYFSSTFLNKIRNVISENVLSPAVVRDYVNDLAKKRKEYIDNLANVIASLNNIGIENIAEDAAQTEIGFQIPRALFNNNLDGLIKEFKAINNIVRTFSEVATGSAEEIRIGQISTTDPLIFLAQSVPVVLTIAKTVNWCLAKWREVEEIRNIRAQTALINHFTKADISFFDQKVQSVIDEGIKQKVEELVDKALVDKARKNELRTALTNALESLFARIERGMTVELRMVTHAPNTEADSKEAESDREADDSQNELNASLGELGQIQLQLKFPTPSSDPVLNLPQSPNNGDENKG